jgi:hypothetical protein
MDIRMECASKGRVGDDYYYRYVGVPLAVYTVYIQYSTVLLL